MREYEAWSCDDVDSVHNDFQRHLIYQWSFPEFERQKVEAWGSWAQSATDGHVFECLAGFGHGPLDKPTGRMMGLVAGRVLRHVLPVLAACALLRVCLLRVCLLPVCLLPVCLSCACLLPVCCLRAACVLPACCLVVLPGRCWELLPAVSTFGTVKPDCNPDNKATRPCCSDTTSLFIVELYEILTHTGDMDFVTKMWPSARRALAWCMGNANQGGYGLPQYLSTTYDHFGFKNHRAVVYVPTPCRATLPPCRHGHEAILTAP